MDKVNEVRKARDKGTIEILLDSIKSALCEQNGIINTSYELFSPVLKESNMIVSENENEEEGYDSDLANTLMDIKLSLVSNNNKLLNFNSKCDL